MKIEGGGNNVSYTITKVGFYMYFICKYRTVDVNVLKKAVIHFNMEHGVTWMLHKDSIRMLHKDSTRIFLHEANFDRQ